MTEKIHYTDEFVKEAEDRPVVIIESVVYALIVAGFVLWAIWSTFEKGG